MFQKLLLPRRIWIPFHSQNRVPLRSIPRLINIILWGCCGWKWLIHLAFWSLILITHTTQNILRSRDLFFFFFRACHAPLRFVHVSCSMLANRLSAPSNTLPSFLSKCVEKGPATKISLTYLFSSLACWMKERSWIGLWKPSFVVSFSSFVFYLLLLSLAFPYFLSSDPDCLSVSRSASLCW